MLNYFRVIDPCMERIVDMGFSPPKDTQNLSLEDEKNSYLNAQSSNVLVDALSIADISQLMSFRDAHELWTKLEDKYGVSKICGDDCSPSTSGRDAFSTSSTYLSAHARSNVFKRPSFCGWSLRHHFNSSG